MRHETRLNWLFFTVLNCAIIYAAHAANPVSKEYVDTQINRINTQLNQLTAQYRVGQLALGGVVYFVYEDANGVQHGLVAAIADEPNSASYAWTSAQSQCANKDEGGYTDWIVPNKAQLTPLFSNRFAIDPNESNGGFKFSINQITNVVTSIYWSSMSAGSSTAWYQNFATGTQLVIAQSSLGYVRCIRTF